MEPVGNIVGFDVVVHRSGDVVNVAVKPGAVILPDGRKQSYRAFAFANADIRDHDHFRVCFEDRSLVRTQRSHADIVNEPAARVVKRCWRDFIHGTRPGLYPGGLVVVGEAEVPPKPPTPTQERARRAANARHARETPITQAKDDAHRLFADWHVGKLPKLRTNELFAMECVRRWPILKQSTLTRKWIPKWRAEAHSGNRSPC